MFIRPLTTELQNKATIELNEVPNRLRDDLDHIQEWIRQQPHLKARSGKNNIFLFDMTSSTILF